MIVESKRKKEMKLKITYNEKKKEVCIIGNKYGLEYLANCCLSVIGKTDPAGHFHLMPQMNNLSKGSLNTIIEYSKHPREYE